MSYFPWGALKPRFLVFSGLPQLWIRQQQAAAQSTTKKTDNNGYYPLSENVNFEQTGHSKMKTLHTSKKLLQKRSLFSSVFWRVGQVVDPALAKL